MPKTQNLNSYFLGKKMADVQIGCIRQKRFATYTDV